jgi:hypothetical protein
VEVEKMKEEKKIKIGKFKQIRDKFIIENLDDFEREFLEEKMELIDAGVRVSVNKQGFNNVVFLREVPKKMQKIYTKEAYDVFKRLQKLEKSNNTKGYEGKISKLQKLREKWFKKTHKIKGQPKIWMWEDDWSDMLDEYEEMVEDESK